MITAQDILPIDVYAQCRAQYRIEMIPLKEQRRVMIGPDVTCLFENKATLLYQIQEMLWIERGGEAQLEDELAAYSPMVPSGHDLTMTMMIEIPDVDTRRLALQHLGHIEEYVVLEIGADKIFARPVDNLERTTPEGKTSAVHFLRFELAADHIQKFRDSSIPVSLGISHPRYTYTTPLSWDTRQVLAQDFR